jgi:NADPH:quinone reductase-like Zn-dependent oxidoreductase
MPDNTAVWLLPKGAGFEIGPAPYTPPGGNEIVVRNHAIAINPVDWLAPAFGGFVFPWIKPPFVIGSDVAGEVVEIGDGVTRFKVGDRVLGHAVGPDKGRNRAAEGAFQQYTVLLDFMATPIPEGMSYETAAVLPLGLSTAACGLFEKDFLALDHPSANPEPTGKTLLIWGGSTSVGSNAIQLATAAGYEVFTTASPKNFDYVKGLGAVAAFDYASPTVVKDLVAALSGKTLAGALAIGLGSSEACLDVVHACPGTKFVALASTSVSFADVPPGPLKPSVLVPLLVRLMIAGVSLALVARLRGVKTHFIFGSSLIHNEVGPMIYDTFLPSALAEGRYKAAPDPIVVSGEGLAGIFTGLELQRRGVSARKVVVSV